MILLTDTENARPVTVPTIPAPVVVWSVLWPNTWPNGNAFLSGKMRETASRLEVAVAKLAEFTNADQVAAFFHNQGIKGVQSSIGGCVAARWLQKVVGDTRITVGNGICLHYGSVMGVMRAPEVVRAFYHRFDQNFYPELVAE